MKIVLEKIRFCYGSVQALEDVSMSFPEGKITAIIGPSGAGKSTLLRLLAGLDELHGGRILFDGQDMSGIPAEKRNIGMVFQSYALFPHMTVRENIAFGLRFSRRRIPNADVSKKIDETMQWLGLTSFAGRRPSELSGGEQQRVALARAIAIRPPLLLMDEPLASLDASLRRAVRNELAGLFRRLGTTILYVTHDQQEAMLLADHLLVLNAGKVDQAGPPLEIYRRPVNRFVGSFLGEANLLRAVVGPGTGKGEFRRLHTPLGDLEYPLNGALEGVPGWLILRPEDFVIHPAGIRTKVIEARGLGAFDRLIVRLSSGEELLIHLSADEILDPGAVQSIAVRPGRGHFLKEDT